MKRIPSTKVLSVFSILILLFFASCNNVFENTISQQQTTDSQEAADDNVVAAQITNSPLTIQINGNLNVEGALPSEFAKAAGRSAKPSIPDGSSYEYYVKATSADSEKLVCDNINRGTWDFGKYGTLAHFLYDVFLWQQQKYWKSEMKFNWNFYCFSYYMISLVNRKLHILVVPRKLAI